MSRRRFHPIRFVMRTLLLVMMVYSGILGFSATEIYGTYKQVEDSYHAYQRYMSDGDYAGALQSIYEVAQGVARIESDLNGWQWQVASTFPVVGEDVRCVRESASIAGNLANNALLPVVGETEELVGEPQSDGILGMVVEKVGQFSDLTDAITYARQAVSSAKDEANKLPVSHFSQINEMTGKLHDMVSHASELVDGASPILDIVDAAGNMADSLV